MLMLHGTYSTIQTEGQIEEALLLDGAATTREFNDCGEMIIVAVHSHFITYFYSWKLKGCWILAVMFTCMS